MEEMADLNDSTARDPRVDLSNGYINSNGNWCLLDNSRMQPSYLMKFHMRILGYMQVLSETNGLHYWLVFVMLLHAISDYLVCISVPVIYANATSEFLDDMKFPRDRMDLYRNIPETIREYFTRSSDFSHLIATGFNQNLCRMFKYFITLVLNGYGWAQAICEFRSEGDCYRSMSPEMLFGLFTAEHFEVTRNFSYWTRKYEKQVEKFFIHAYGNTFNNTNPGFGSMNHWTWKPNVSFANSVFEGRHRLYISAFPHEFNNEDLRKNNYLRLEYANIFFTGGYMVDVLNYDDGRVEPLFDGPMYDFCGVITSEDVYCTLISNCGSVLAMDMAGLYRDSVKMYRPQQRMLIPRFVHERELRVAVTINNSYYFPGNYSDWLHTGGLLKRKFNLLCDNLYYLKQLAAYTTTYEFNLDESLKILIYFRRWFYRNTNIWTRLNIQLIGDLCCDSDWAMVLSIAWIVETQVPFLRDTLDKYMKKCDAETLGNEMLDEFAKSKNLQQVYRQQVNAASIMDNLMN
jgi:hypothetical protein